MTTTRKFRADVDPTRVPSSQREGFRWTTWTIIEIDLEARTVASDYDSPDAFYGGVGDVPMKIHVGWPVGPSAMLGLIERFLPDFDALIDDDDDIDPEALDAIGDRIQEALSETSTPDEDYPSELAADETQQYMAAADAIMGAFAGDIASIPSDDMEFGTGGRIRVQGVVSVMHPHHNLTVDVDVEAYSNSTPADVRRQVADTLGVSVAELDGVED